MTEPREFQQQAIDRIVEALSSRSGTGRFLLADEVGLGKTIVASGVVSELASRRRNGGLVVVYLCSNREIASQNQGKLGSGLVIAADRLSFVAEKTQEIARARRHNQAIFLAFTPGTSLDLRRATGLARERLLLLYILKARFGYPVGRAPWVRFFQCSAGKATWPRRVREELSGFEGCLSREVQATVARRWRRSLIAELEEEVRVGEPWPNRSTLIGRMRHDLACAVAETLSPDLVVLDEFQNFPKVLERADSADSVESLLLRRRTKVLLLSATPYTIYASDDEDNSHSTELMKVLGFLSRRPPDDLGPLAKKITKLTSTVESLRFIERDDRDLLQAKRDVERELKTMMCRTERNWYLHDVGKGTDERLVSERDAHPTAPEVGDYLLHHDALRDARGNGLHCVDYWKSSPAFLAFMDASYVDVTAARKRKGLSARLSTPKRPSNVIERNLRLRVLAEKAAGLATRAHEHLWVEPSYRYYGENQGRAQPHDGEQGPSKFLVFSHWRFVPKMIAATLSDAVEGRIGRLPQSSPLSAGRDRGTAIADVCLSSTWLAELLSPIEVCRALGTGVSAEQFVARAMSMIRKSLSEQYDVQISKRGPVSAWRLLARLDSEHGGELLEALRDVGRANAFDTAGLVRRFGQWSKDAGRKTISPRALRHLTEIALFSPAVCITRAINSAFGPATRTEDAEERRCLLARLTFGSMRHYFNRPIVQAIVRRRSTGPYTRRLLRFCEREHFCEVMDEYAPLLRSASRDGTLKETLASLERIFGLGQGSPKANEVKGGRLRVGTRTLHSHFAMAFGEETESDDVGDGAKHRRTKMREAFNSPFWPFVLATTSVGQEGLDFHLYCRDVVHWNLPTNPVDFEQREGRINRYGAAWVRRAIAQDYPLDTLLSARAELRSPWPEAFQHAEQSDRRQRYKHGLFPYWIYERGPGAVAEGIRRHVVFHATSDDGDRYRRLLDAVSLYRLAFGQPNQRDLLRKIEGKLAGFSEERQREIKARLPAYMVNLSPFPEGYALQKARNDAKAFATDTKALEQLLEDVMAIHLPELADQAHLTVLTDHLRECMRNGRPPRPDAIAALEYLRNPYDDLFDAQVPHGLEDDVAEIRRAAKRLAARPPLH